MSFSIGDGQKVVFPPVLSPDNQFLAILVNERDFCIFSTRTGAIVDKVQLPKSVETFVPDLQILKWAPDNEPVPEPGSKTLPEVHRTWILLAGGHRLMTLEVYVRGDHRSHLEDGPFAANVTADYSLETQNGKIVIADFIFNHRQAFVTFEMATVASVISFVGPQRNDIQSPKYRGRQGYVQAIGGQYFALMLRSKGQDQIVVYTSKDNALDQVSMFAPGMIDAQGMLWSPNGDPLLAVWESAAYGAFVRFFTASGHPLKQLDLQHNDVSPDSRLLSAPGVGITRLSWSTSGPRDTLLAYGDGDLQLMLRVQNARSMEAFSASSYVHGAVIEVGQSRVWQQSSVEVFEPLSTSVELPLGSSAEVDMIEINTDATLIATRLDSLANTLWIWGRDLSSPVALIMLQKDIKRVLWHPLLKNVLVMVTGERAPRIYIWYNVHEPPRRVALPSEKTFLPGRWNADWIKMSDTHRCPLMIYSNRNFDLGLLSHVDDELVFTSLLLDDDTSSFLDEDSVTFETPSKRPGGGLVKSHLNYASPEWWNTGRADGEW